MNQNSIILNHLEEYGSLTAREAYEKYGIMRLGARVHDLKEFGYQIGKTTETGKNRYGKTVSFARYFYEGERNG